MMKKQIISLLLSVSLLPTIMAFPAALAAGETSADDAASASRIVMSYTPDKTEAEKGEEVVYTVTLDEITESRGFQTELSYDASGLELVSAEKGELLSNAGRVSGIVTSTYGKVGIVCAYETEMEETGVAAILTFKVKSDAPVGISEMTALSPLAVDADYNYIDAEGVNNIGEVYIGRMPRNYEISLTTDAEKYMPGDTVYLTLDMGEVSKFIGLQFDVNFDSDKLTYIVPSRVSEYYGSVMRGAVAKSISSLKAADGIVNVLTARGKTDTYSGAGDICTLAFKVNDYVDAQTEIYLSNIVPKSGDTVTADTVSVAIDPLPNYRVTDFDDSSDTITVTVEHNGGTDKPVLIIAQYDADGAMLDADVSTLSISEGGEQTFTVEKEENCETVRYMIWDSMESMIPYII